MRLSQAFESPSDRLNRCGADALGAEELIALVLQKGQCGQGGLQAARRLAQEFGSVSKLAIAEPEELIASSGITSDEAAALVSCFRLARFASREAPPPSLSSAADVAAVAMGEIGSATRERTIVLVCDAANQLRRVVPVGAGSIDRALLQVREILNAVLRHDGRAFAVAHSHASGDPTPSTEDIQATTKLSAAAGVVGLRFLDHVVVAKAAWQSATQPPRRRGSVPRP